LYVLLWRLRVTEDTGAPFQASAEPLITAFRRVFHELLQNLRLAADNKTGYYCLERAEEGAVGSVLQDGGVHGARWP
jgi:hypothetical protein